MKVIIVEVTRAANSFGAAHLGKIREAYRQIQGIVEDAQRSGEFRIVGHRRVRGDGVLRSDRAGADRMDLRTARRGRGSYERAKDNLVETICGGLEN